MESGAISQAEQTAAILVRFEKELIENKTDVVLVVSDVTTKMACTITPKRHWVLVVYVEEAFVGEIITWRKRLTELLPIPFVIIFITSETANRFLRRSGVSNGHIHFVGNTMVDTFMHSINR